MISGRSAFGFALLLLLAPPGAPGQGAPPPAQTPTFRTEVEYVEVDVRVTDDQGRFVRDLAAGDFQVLEDGRRQAIAAFSLVEIPIESGSSPVAPRSDPGVRSNARPFDGRIYVLILDDLHTQARWSDTVKRAARQFITGSLGAGDLMAVVTVGGGAASVRTLTSDKTRLLAAVDRFAGGKLPPASLEQSDRRLRNAELNVSLSTDDPFDAERARHAHAAYVTVRDIAEWLGGVRGRRKTVLLLSEGVDYDVSRLMARGQERQPETDGILADLQEAIGSANRANVNIYAIDPRGLTQLADEAIVATSLAGGTSASLQRELLMSQASLRAVADETGGFAVVNSNDFKTVLDRIVADNSTYYVLAYQPASSRRDGRTHTIAVRVGRPGLTVRARSGYTSPKGKAQPSAIAIPGLSAEARDALASPFARSGLPMRVFAARFRGKAATASVLLGVEIPPGSVPAGAGAAIELAYVAFDAGGAIRGGSRDTLGLNLQPASRARADASGLRILNRLELPPGSYQIRVASHALPDGVTGSVVIDLEVPELAAEPFGMSDIVLTSMAGSNAVTARPDEALRTALPAAPIGLRTFTTRDEIAVFAEIYDRTDAMPHKTSIEMMVVAEDGTRVIHATDDLDATARYGYSARIPLKELRPGDYVLVIEARSHARKDAPVARQIRFTVTP